MAGRTGASAPLHLAAELALEPRVTRVWRKSNLLLIQHNAEVNALLLFIQKKGECGDEEYKAYRRAVGNIMGANYDIMQALYHEHPDLKPEGLGGPLKTDHLRFELAEQLHDLAAE